MAARSGYAGPPAKRKKNPPAGRSASRRAPVRQIPVQQETRHKKPKALARYSDYSLILVVLFLLAIGLIMLYSTSSYEAGIEYGDGAYYLKRQLLFTLLGLVAMVICNFLPYQFWKKSSFLLYGFSIMLILLIIPFGREVNGAKRWLYFGPISVQPAEISKLAVIVVTARILTEIPKKKLKKWRTLFLVMIPAVVQAAMIYFITDNMSSAIIVAAIGACVLFVVIRDFWRYFLLAGFVGAGGFGWLYYVTHSSSDLGFRSQRLLVWLDPEKYADGKGFQVLQGLYGIGSGGMFGKGLGNSMQKLGYIPEAQNDMIFSIICEELGVFGAVSIIILFVILCWRLMLIANNSEDLFGSLLTVGVMVQIAVQVILNIAVVTNTIPNTGVSLPFISYGGSSVIILLAEIGITMNVARNIRLRELR
ncbi:MAG: putative lipid II flippase FtsW [Lachnospiraceae bacterium]|jgi:cell division protein FtsW|nr:putative lipid II flippase FtsW [Lachnospiraceae bacterium]MCI1398801.1 putative lipid II flippase FtsW [Lachnospiraceae bacterium]MCI1424858.1 putative lipid II flippase FtsW [Lachnospiraceae bacterium]MCI1453558.1 putative lipid II flippase FtsW [Lachnospiraceae bacterium]MDD5848373.1 putative peptidoglycan glycosyltransferase FtsW [Bacillota bacterium]